MYTSGNLLHVRVVFDRVRCESRFWLGIGEFVHRSWFGPVGDAVASGSSSGSEPGDGLCGSTLGAELAGSRVLHSVPRFRGRDVDPTNHGPYHHHQPPLSLA